MVHRPVKSPLTEAVTHARRSFQREKVCRLGSRRGSTAIEFALVMICAVPMFFGMVAMGITIGKAVEATQVTSDIGRMYGEGTDFTSAAAQQLAASLAIGYTLTSTGNTELIFSQITPVSTVDCTAAGVSPCSNQGSQVIIQRIYIGNTSLMTSSFGTPPTASIDSLGNIPASDYMTLSTCIAPGFSSVLVQADGAVANVVEGYYTVPNIKFLAPGYLGGPSTEGYYVRAIF
jgi:Flp pilus assembly protein TadG